ncbi:MAG: Hint domain-containing protein [Paracoccus aminovorans]|nr:Hint domain-containing protein [Paracoccus aminovorans]
MVTIPGTAGNDSLVGTADNDWITGDAGDDTLQGGAGRDTLDGATGSDVVDGGSGADQLIWSADSGSSGAPDDYHGGDGEDGYNPDVYSLSGGDTLSMVTAGAGAGGFEVTFSTPNSGTAQDAFGNTLSFDGIERVSTGNGADFIDATGAAPVDGQGIRIQTGGGDDTVLAGNGANYINTGDGNDIVHGGSGYDLVETGTGDDTIYGNGGTDGFRWGDGNYNGAIGNDVYYGEYGTGTIDPGSTNTLNAWQHDTDGNGVRLVLNTSTSGTVDATGAAAGHLDFYEFNNVITGSGNDTVDGSGAGVDGFRTYTAWGDDSILGSAGNDEIEGGWGSDTIDAGAGNDRISMAGDLNAAHAWDDDGQDLLVLRDGFGNDTVRAFTIRDYSQPNDWGGVDHFPQDRLDVSGLHDADGNPINLDDVTVGSYVDPRDDSTHALLTFPNGESLVLYEVDPADLTQARLHELGIPCFCRGTLIATDRGEIAVEQLAVGDLVVTRDHGLQPICWIGTRALDAVDLATAPKLRPIRIRAGALGRGLPRAELMVSPQHRVLVRSAIAQRMFGAPEVLVAAKQLLAIAGIEQVEAGAVEYIHLLFERHEIVLSNGAETESLYTGAEALKSVGAAARDEILTLFPELREGPAAAARPLVPGGKARQLAERHARNGKALIG